MEQLLHRLHGLVHAFRMPLYAEDERAAYRFYRLDDAVRSDGSNFKVRSQRMNRLVVETINARGVSEIYTLSLHDALPISCYFVRP